MSGHTPWREIKHARQEVQMKAAAIIDDLGVRDVYVAGPMSWRPQFNFPVFDQAAAKLRSLGFNVVSPAELDDEKARAEALASPDGAPSSTSLPWGDALARDLDFVLRRVHGVVALPEWRTSRGACLEITAATCLDKPVFRYPDLQQYVIPDPTTLYEEVPE